MVGRDSNKAAGLGHVFKADELFRLLIGLHHVFLLKLHAASRQVLDHTLQLGHKVHIDLSQAGLTVQGQNMPTHRYRVEHLPITQHLLARIQSKIHKLHQRPHGVLAHCEFWTGGGDYVEVLAQLIEVVPHRLAGHFGSLGVGRKLFCVVHLLGLQRVGLGFELIEEAHVCTQRIR